MIRWTWSLWSKTENFEIMWSGTGTGTSYYSLPHYSCPGACPASQKLKLSCGYPYFPERHSPLVWRSCTQSVLLNSRSRFIFGSAELSFFFLTEMRLLTDPDHFALWLCLHLLFTWKTSCYLKILLAAFFMLVFRTMIKALNDMAHYTNPCRIPVDVPYSKLISCWHSYSWDLLANNFLTRIRYVLLRLCSVHGWRRITAQSIDLARMDVSHICWQIVL